MSASPFCRVSYDGHMQIIEFDYPKKKNAWPIVTYKLMIAALERGKKDDNIKMTVLTGRGTYYSSGNLFAFQPESTSDNVIDDAIFLTKKLIDDFIDYPKVLVAVVNGPAIGVACTTLALCDAVYAVETAWFHTPFANWGITAEGCSSYLFPRIMGPAKAGRMLYFSEKMTASEALKCNFITETYKPSAADLLWTKLRSFTSFSLGSWMGTKRLLREHLIDELHKVNDREVKTLQERFASDDFMNALIGFMSKSKI